MINPDRVAFSLFGRDIYWFALILIFAGVCAIITASIVAKHKKVTLDEVIDMALWCVPLSLIGSRLYFVLFNLADYAQNPVTMLYIWQGGLALPGAILGGMLGVFIYSRIRKRRFLRFADVLVPGVILAQAIGRWGDFVNQMSYGPQITDPSQLWFPLGVRIDITGTCHYALFFYESLWCILIFIAVLLLFKHFRHDGDAFIFYLLFYSAERFVIEQLRVDSLMLGNVRITQILCAVVCLASLLFVIVRYIAERRAQAILWPTPESDAPPSMYGDIEKEASRARTLEEQSAGMNATPDEKDIPVFTADREDFRRFGVTLPGEDTAALKLDDINNALNSDDASSDKNGDAPETHQHHHSNKNKAKNKK